MKLLSKSALSVAIVAAMAASATQAESVTIDPSLKLTYKNYYWKEDKKSAGTSDRDEWVHALVADFDTGYVNDMVGAVVTVGAADKIDTFATKDNAGNALSRNITNLATGEDGKANGIAGVQQAFLKAKYKVGEVELKGSYGVKKRSYELYGDSGSRILAASSTGLDLSASGYGFTVYGSQIDGYSPRNQSTLSEDLTNAAGKKIDKVQIFGANYKIAGVGLTAEFAKSQDYVKNSFFKADYSVKIDDNMSVDLDGRYGKSEEDGSLYATKGYESSYYNLNATLNYGPAFVGLGYNKTKDGDYSKALFKADTGTFNSSLAGWEDFALEDEKAYIVSAGYDFADMLPGLKVNAWFAKGKDAKDVKDFKRREIGGYTSYAFDGQLKGLSLAWLHINYRAEGTRNNAAVGGLYDKNINRFYLKYSVSVF
ncbi:OprD family outer membrane porin [Endozoicomonadaceae bacterium StTr2]